MRRRYSHYVECNKSIHPISYSLRFSASNTAEIQKRLKSKTTYTMSATDDCLCILHASDGTAWANFLSKRLSKYNLRSVVRSLSYAEPNPEQAKIYDSSTGSNESSSLSNTSSTGLNNSETDSDFTKNFRSCVVLLSPEILLSPFPFDVCSMNQRQTVFLFLGADTEEVRKYFPQKQSEFVFDCRCSVIHVDEKSISDALVNIIEAYEGFGDENVYDDEEDIYKTPDERSWQVNNIKKVFPREVTQRERDVYILMERPAEYELFAHLVSSGENVPLNCVHGSMYIFRLPDNVVGDVSFRIEYDGHIFGEGSVQAYTKLDRLKAILSEEVRPLAVIAAALGLDRDDVVGIDQALAFRLRQLSSKSTFELMFPSEEALGLLDEDERADVSYPSLLHFAAEYNLQEFCKELLTYPGMLAAAMTENKEGDYPDNIATRNGHSQLADELIKFVKDQKAENDLYIEPSQITPPPPKPHSFNRAHNYVNEKLSKSTGNVDYIDMKCVNPKAPFSATSPQSQTSDVISPVSSSSDSVFLPGANFNTDVTDVYQDYSGAMRQRLNSIPAEPARKALIILGARQEDISRSKQLSLDATHSRSEGAVQKLPGNISYGLRSPGTCQMNPSFDRASVSSNCDDPAAYGLCPGDSKQKLNKFMAFFGRKKRSGSDGEIVYTQARVFKKTASTKSDKFNKKSPNKSCTDESRQERDSGSFTDDEKEPKSTASAKKNSKPKEFKERGKPMARRKSKRAQMASEDRVTDAPGLPCSDKKKGTFKSFIDNV